MHRSFGMFVSVCICMGFSPSSDQKGRSPTMHQMKDSDGKVWLGMYCLEG